MSLGIQLLSSRRFLPLFVTQFLGAFNDNAFKNALLIWIAYESAAKSGEHTAILINLAAGVFILPFFLFSALAGQLADKFEKAWLSQKIKQAECIIMCLAAYFFIRESLLGLFGVLFLMGLQSTFFGPIKYSLLPEHLKRDELIAGNGLIELGTFLSILMGTLVGGLLVRSATGFGVLLTCLVLFSVIGYLGSRAIPRARLHQPDLKIDWNVFRASDAIISDVKKVSLLWRSILAISWFWFVGATCLTQFPLYTQTVVGGDETVVTLFLVLFCLGVGTGSMLCNAFMKGVINARLVPYGCWGMSCCLLLLIGASYAYCQCWSPQPQILLNAMQFLQRGFVSWCIVFSLMGLAFSAGIYIVPLYALLQHHSPQSTLGRILAANNIMNALFMVGASVLAVALFALGFELVELFLAVAVLNFGVCVLVRRIVHQKGNNG